MMWTRAGIREAAQELGELIDLCEEVVRRETGLAAPPAGLVADRLKAALEYGKAARLAEVEAATAHITPEYVNSRLHECFIRVRGECPGCGSEGCAEKVTDSDHGPVM